MPLSEAFTAILQSDRTSALAAAVVIGTCHADVLQWVARTIQPVATEPRPRRKRRARNGGGRRNGSGDYADRRRSRRDEADQRLLEVMRAAPGATIGAWAEATERSRSSTVSSLHRLRDAGLASNEDGIWALTEDPAPREPAVPWVEPEAVAATSMRRRGRTLTPAEAHASA